MKGRKFNRARRIGQVVAVVAIASCLVPALGPVAAKATTGTITLFGAGISPIGPGDAAAPVGITTGPDGNLWFTEEGGNFDGNRIGRITPAGVVTEFSTGITPGAAPSAITTGSDGNLWFTEPIANNIGRINPITRAVTEFPLLTPNSFPLHMTTGPDGNVWFSEVGANNIGRITPAGVVTEFPIPAADFAPGSSPQGITTGSDGELWFAEFSGGAIGRIDPTTGVITAFPVGPVANDTGPIGITNGPDGNLWVTGYRQNVIWRVTTSGAVTNFPVQVAHPSSIVTGAGGNLWFTDEEGTIGRMSPDGTETEFTGGVTPGEDSGDITLGPDGNLWFGVGNNDQVGRLEDDPQSVKITVTKTAPDQGTVKAGDKITYNLLVTNNASPTNGGNAVAPHVSLVDTLPAGAVFQSVEPASANCNFQTAQTGGGSVICDLGALDQHSSALVDVVVRAFPAAAGPFTNTASVFSSGHQGNTPADGTSSTTTNVTCPRRGCPPALQIAKNSQTEDVNPGDTIPFNLTVTNAGSVAGHEVSLVDDLPAGGVFQPTGSSPNCTFQPSRDSAGSVVCELGELAGNSSTTVNLNLQAFPPQSSAGPFDIAPFVNTVSVYSGRRGPDNPAIDTSTLNVNVFCPCAPPPSDRATPPATDPQTKPTPGKHRILAHRAPSKPSLPTPKAAPGAPADPATGATTTAATATATTGPPTTPTATTATAATARSSMSN